MSMSISNTDGVSVITIIPDPHSRWPVLCQIMKSLCWRPMCSSRSQPLGEVQGKPQFLLGVIHILIGLLHTGLLSDGFPWHPSWYPFLKEFLFILCGIICILSEKIHNPCLVFLNVIVNLTGTAVAISAIVIHSKDMDEIHWESCEFHLRSIIHTLLLLSVVEVCVSISSAVLGIKALCDDSKEHNETAEDPEIKKPLLEEVTAEPAA